MSELAELFTTSELIDWQAVETTRATTPETSAATATQTTGSGTGWTTATRLGVLAGSAAVLTALTTATRGTKGERPEGAANQTETETDSSESSEGSAGTETETTETDTQTQGGETDTEGDEEDTDAGMPTDQDTDTDEGTDAETSEETPDTDTDTHNPPQPVDPATHGDSDGEEDASTDSDDSDSPDSDGTEGSGETSTATAGTNTNTDDTDQQDSDQDNTNTAPAPPVDPNAETEGGSGTDQSGSSTAPDNRGTDPDEGGDNAGHEDADSMAPPPPVDQNNTAGPEQNESDGSENEPLTNGVDSTDTDGENSVAGPGPANSPGSVIINGTETEDQVLTATLNDADGLPDGVDIRYQWQRNTGADSAFENIDNATSKTYTLGDGDVGREVRVQVSYTDGNSTDETLTSEATTAVTNINDDPTGSVSIEGTAEEDQILTANVDNVADEDGLGAFSYQWQRNTGANDAFENIAGATGNTYTLDDADVGREVRVMVSYTDDGGMDETLTSAPTTAVININDEPTGSVSIDGTVREDETLTANTDTLADADALPADAEGYRYQWQRSNDSNGFDNIPTATSQSYNLDDADVGREVRVQASYTDGNSTPESLTSDATNAVTNINDAPSGSVTIDGTATEDETLTANTDNLADADGLGTLNYQWQSNTGANGAFENIENATSQTYILGDNDVGREVQVMVSYTDDGGMDESLTSAATTAVANINDDPSGSVTIDGTVREDQTLTADIRALQDADGLPTLADAFTYEWQRNTGANGGFENIENATSETYTLGDADVNREVRVLVSYTDARGEDETVISDVTAAVGNVNDLPTGAITIDGTVRGDETLTANTGALADEDGLPDDVAGYNYQWQRSDGSDGFENIEDATGQSYTLGNEDVGREVQVMVSYTDGNNTDESLNSMPTAEVGTANIAPTGGVRIDGTVRQGQQLSADRTALRDADGLPDNAEGYRYQWQRTQADDTFADIEDATEQTYTVAMADVGQRLQVVVSYTDGNGADETLTAATVSAAVSNADDPVIDEANTQTGTAGNDFLRSDAGNQRLNGLGGDDLLRGGAGADILDGGAGVDLARYLFDPADIEIDLETGTGTGGQAEGDVLVRIENISGGNGNDRLTGNNTDNRLNGFFGNDILNGGAGNDRLFGGSSDDRLDGGDGNDRLEGQNGDDILIGGMGNDVFRFQSGFDGSDRITDFGTGNDRLEFGGGLFANLEAVRTAATQTDDGNLEITLSETETLTLEGFTLAALTADTVTTLDAEGNDTTTPPADAASDAPAFELDNLSINEEAIMRLAASESMTLPPPEPQAAQSASEPILPADKTLTVADSLEPPPALALFDADLEGYAGL